MFFGNYTPPSELNADDCLKASEKIRAKSIGYLSEELVTSGYWCGTKEELEEWILDWVNFLDNCQGYTSC